MSYKDDVRLIKALADEKTDLLFWNLSTRWRKCGCVLLEEPVSRNQHYHNHMKILCDTGIVDSCKDGKWMHYSLSF